MDRFEELTTSVGYRFNTLDKRVDEMKSLAVSLDRRMRGLRQPQPGLTGRERFTKHALIKLCGGAADVDATYRERFVSKATTNPAMTNVPGWASELTAIDTLDFLLGGDAPSLLGRLFTYGLDIGERWTTKLPIRTDNGHLGGWTAEADPAPVGSLSFGALTPVVRKVVAISVFSRDLQKHSTPSIEGVLDRFLRRDINFHADSALIDDQPVSAKRPAGLLFGLTATAPGSSLIDDLKALAAEVLDAGGTSVVYLVNPLTLIDIGFMAGTLSYPVLDSPYIPAGRIIALDPLGFVASLSAATIDTTENTTLHLSDVPLPIVDGAGAVAQPISSLWQTGNIGMRAILDTGWGIQPGRIAFLDRAAP